MRYICTAVVNGETYTQETEFPQAFQNKWAKETQCRASFTFWSPEVVNYFHVIPANNLTFRLWAQAHLWFADYDVVFDQLTKPTEPTPDLYSWLVLEDLIRLTDTFHSDKVCEEAVVKLINDNATWLARTSR